MTQADRDKILTAVAQCKGKPTKVTIQLPNGKNLTAKMDVTQWGVSRADRPTFTANFHELGLQEGDDA